MPLSLEFWDLLKVVDESCARDIAGITIARLNALINAAKINNLDSFIIYLLSYVVLIRFKN